MTVWPLTDLGSCWVEWGQVPLSHSSWWPRGRPGTGSGHCRSDLVRGGGVISKISGVCAISSVTFVTSYMCRTHLPAIVLTKMRYSKLVISLRCQRWVMFAALKSCFGVAREIRLTKTENQITSIVAIRVLSDKNQSQSAHQRKSTRGIEKKHKKPWASLCRFNTDAMEWVIHWTFSLAN